VSKCKGDLGLASQLIPEYRIKVHIAVTLAYAQRGNLSYMAPPTAFYASQGIGSDVEGPGYRRMLPAMMCLRIWLPNWGWSKCG